jgi:hypothetical protein
MEDELQVAPYPGHTCTMRLTKTRCELLYLLCIFHLLVDRNLFMNLCHAKPLNTAEDSHVQASLKT